MKKTKMIPLILSVCISLCLTGCWDMVEVDKIAIVMALGIDKIPGPQPYLLTVQIVNPPAMKKGAGGGGTEKPFLTASVKGETMYDAILNFSKNSPRRFYFSHIAIIILGEKMAQSGILPIKDFLERDNQFRRTIWLLETPKTAQEILHSTLQLEKIPAIGIEDIILESKQSSITELVQRKDFIREITSKSHAAILSKLDLISQQLNKATVRNEKTKETQKGDADGNRGENLQLSGEAVFNKDKLVGYLTNTETRGLLWILGKMNGDAVIIRYPEKELKTKENKTKAKNIVLKCKSIKSQITPSLKGGKLNVLIRIQAEGEIKESDYPTLDVTNEVIIKKLEALANQQIKMKIRKSIQKAQHLKTDIFGIGNKIYRDHPDIWEHLEKSWEHQFQQMEVQVYVTSKIKQIGTITRPIHVGE